MRTVETASPLSLKLVLILTRGLLRDQELRRRTMFFVVLGALGMLFAGSTFLADALRTHVIAFILFWAACGWLTILAVLLALFDILVVRAQARAAKRAIRLQILIDQEKNDSGR